MSDQQDERDQRITLPQWFVIFLLLVFLVYPVSLGPAAWLYLNMLSGQFNDFFVRAIEAYLAPGEYVYSACGEPEWFSSYVNWWMRI